MFFSRISSVFSSWFSSMFSSFRFSSVVSYQTSPLPGSAPCSPPLGLVPCYSSPGFSSVFFFFRCSFMFSSSSSSRFSSIAPCYSSPSSAPRSSPVGSAPCPPPPISVKLFFRKFKMVKGRKWVLKRHFSGEPKIDDFELVEEELPELKDGEIMFRFSLYSN